MTSLKNLVKAVRDDKPITIRHEKWLEDNPDPVYTVDALLFAAQELQDTSNNTPSRPEDRMFRSSGMGSCPRQRYLLRLGTVPETRPNSRTSNIFHTGKFIHLKWQMAGITEGWLAKAEVTYQDDRLQLRGHTDGINYDGSLLEIKSINDRGFTYVYKNGIKPEHKLQGASYLMMADLEAMSFIYENKNSAEWWEIRYHRNEKDEKEVIEEMEVLVEAWEAKRVPKPLSSCLRKEGFAYNYCPFKAACLAMHEEGE